MAGSADRRIKKGNIFVAAWRPTTGAAPRRSCGRVRLSVGDAGKILDDRSTQTTDLQAEAANFVGCDGAAPKPEHGFLEVHPLSPRGLCRHVVAANLPEQNSHRDEQALASIPDTPRDLFAYLEELRNAAPLNAAIQ